MKIAEKISFYRQGQNIVMASDPHFGEEVEFRISAIHIPGHSRVIVIKHSGKVIAIARATKEFKTQPLLCDIKLLSLHQLNGDPIPSCFLAIESEVNPRARISSIDYPA